MSAPTKRADRTEISRAIPLLCKPGAVYELRALGTRKGTVSGYFDNVDKLIEAALIADKLDAIGTYITINPVKRDVLARAANTHRVYAKTTTSDPEIERRLWLPIDCDAVRPKDTSSTEEEHEAALNRAREVRAFLLDSGFRHETLGDSGNGGHLLFPIDLPNDDASADLLRRVLDGLAAKFSDNIVTIDRKNFNASRIWKLYGTIACKGSNVPERPHRMARIVAAFRALAPMEPVSLELLESIATPKRTYSNGNGNGFYARFDLDRFLQQHSIAVKRIEPWNGGRNIILEQCLFDPTHVGTSASIIELPNGALSYACQHNTCHERTWADVRSLFEPDYFSRLNRFSRNSNGQQDAYAYGHTADPEPEPADFGRFNRFGRNSTSGENAEQTVEQRLYPELDAAALYGVAGDFIDLVYPDSEADKAGLLIAFLVGMGNIVARHVYRTVDAARHYLNLFAVLCGPTSMGRKGTAEAQVKRMLKLLTNEQWILDHVGNGLSSGEGLIWNVRDPIYREEAIREKGRVTGEYQTVMVDRGVDDKRLLVIEPEFSSVLRQGERDGNTLSPLIRLAYDSGNLRIMNKNAPARATGAHISVIGEITPEELLRHLNSTEAANGFANRFLWVCVRRSKELPFGGSLQDSDYDGLINKLLKVQEWASDDRQLEWELEAREGWKEVYGKLSSGRPGLLGAVLARAAAQVLRLSCMYATLDCSPVIAQPHLDAALAVWEYCEASAEYLFTDALGDPDADAILGALRNSPNGLTRTDIRDLFQRHLSAARMEQALGSLLKHNLATVEVLKTGGRPLEVWRAKGATKATEATKGSESPVTNGTGTAI